MFILSQFEHMSYTMHLVVCHDKFYDNIKISKKLRNNKTSNEMFKFDDFHSSTVIYKKARIIACYCLTNVTLHVIKPNLFQKFSVLQMKKIS